MFKIKDMHRQECTLHLLTWYTNTCIFNEIGRPEIWDKKGIFLFRHTYIRPGNSVPKD